MQKDQHRAREKPPKLRSIYVVVVTTTPNRMNKKAWVHITLHTPRPFRAFSPPIGCGASCFNLWQGQTLHVLNAPPCKVPIYRFMVTQLATLDNIFRLLTHAPMPFRKAILGACQGAPHLCHIEKSRISLSCLSSTKNLIQPSGKKPFQF